MINYQELLNESLIEFLRKVLIKVQQEGLSGAHHFYISFSTKDSNVKLSDKMLLRYPNEITIILQNQFEVLSVTLHGFSVKLSFDGVPEIVEIPFRCITSFSDPSVNFSLQLKNQPKSMMQSDVKITKDKALDTKDKDTKTTESKTTSNVIVLDLFRKSKKPK
ncbi:MAG: ClpXP protease specificity-enhancing factor SspB [Janthinobacterium lividum]